MVDLRAESHFFSEAWLSPDGFPARRPSTLMSSSSVFQWMPCPRPINRQFLRSAGVACTSRGNQVSGTERLRPSLSSTVKVSSVTITISAAGIEISTAEVCIPCLSKGVLIRDHKVLKTTDLCTRESSALLQPNRIEPKFRQVVFSFNMNVGRFIPISRIEEESIGTSP